MEKTQRNAEPVALVALPGRLSGACLRLPVLRADLYSFRTYSHSRLRCVLNNKKKGVTWRMERRNRPCVAWTRARCPVASEVSGGAESRPFRAHSTCTPYNGQVPSDISLRVARHTSLPAHQYCPIFECTRASSLSLHLDQWH